MSDPADSHPAGAGAASVPGVADPNSAGSPPSQESPEGALPSAGPAAKPRRPGELSGGQVAAIVVPLLLLVALWFTNPGTREYLAWLRKKPNIFQGPSMAQTSQAGRVLAATRTQNAYVFTLYETHSDQPAVNVRALGIATQFIALPASEGPDKNVKGGK